MRDLNTTELQSVEISGGSFSEFITTVSGAGIGAAITAKYLHDSSASWLGLVQIPITFAGGVIGGKMAHTLYNIDAATTPEENKGTFWAYLVA